MTDMIDDVDFSEELISGEVVGWSHIGVHCIDEISSLINVEDYSTTSHYRGLYGLDSQIRLLNNILYHAIRSHGRLTSHTVLQGPPGCGKTSLLTAVERIIGENGVLKIDATKTTRAGLERLFFNELPQIPPVILLEEIEKSNPDDLMIYLGMLDSRQEIRKVTSRGSFVRRVNSLVIATCNDMDKFERVAAGALASRFATQIHFPRPNIDILKMILCRYSNDHGIDNAPVDQVLELSQDCNITDPRRLCSYLLQSNFDDVRSNLAMKMFKRQPSKRKIDPVELNNIIMKGSGVM